MRHLYLIVGCLSFLLVSCNSTPVKPELIVDLSAEQIDVMQNFDELVAMREKLAAGLAGKTKEKYAEDFATLGRIESKIASVKKSDLLSKFDAERTTDGVIAKPTLSALLTSLRSEAPVSAEKWAPVLTLVEKELGKTNAYISGLTQKLGAESDPLKKVVSLDQLAKVDGESDWSAQRDTLLSDLVAQVRKASEGDALGQDTRSKLAVIKQLSGDDAALLDEMIGVDAKIYEKDFFNFLADGDADSAYQTLETMASANDFPTIKDKLAPTSQKMAEYFDALAKESVSDSSKLKQSYRWFNQARGVRSILDVSAPQASSYGDLVQQLQDRYESLKKAEEQSAALAHLYAISQFQPNLPGLRKKLVDQETAVRDLAVKRLSTTDFQSPYKDQDYGDVISSFITQYLFEHVPNDVRIVEREQYEAILRERSLSGDTSSLSSVNLLVSGSVLESKVDSSEAKNKKMMRVEVGKESVPNPNYISWLKMDSKDRKTVEQPAETTEVSKYENVSVGVTRHRKIGIFSVSYRLVEASTGRVIFPDSITVNSEHEDESSEGVEMGDFKVDFKLADLPSDVEILDDLARKVATQIGESLVEVLKDQDQKYLAQAKVYAEQNDCVGEVGSLGNALMIMKLKNLDVSTSSPAFRDKGVACFN